MKPKSQGFFIKSKGVFFLKCLSLGFLRKSFLFLKSCHNQIIAFKEVFYEKNTYLSFDIT